MAERFQVPSNLPRITPTRTPGQVRRSPQTGAHIATDFSTLLNQELQKTTIKFSAHAEKRLAARNIRLTPEQLAELEQAVDRLQAKGGRESLVLLGEVAFVVSVANRTVITAVDGESMKDNVFTNIDSAVLR